MLEKSMILQNHGSSLPLLTSMQEECPFLQVYLYIIKDFANNYTYCLMVLSFIQ